MTGTDVQWWESHGTAVGDVTSLAVPAYYVIEQYRLVSDGESVDVNGRLQPILAFHRITAIGTGRRIITSTFHCLSTSLKLLRGYRSKFSDAVGLQQWGKEPCAHICAV